MIQLLLHSTFLSSNLISTFLLVLVIAGFLLVSIKYLYLKKDIHTIIHKLNDKHREEIQQFKDHFYRNLNHDFKIPMSQVIRILEQMEEENKEEKIKNNIKELLKKTGLIYHKLNRWPNKGKVKENKVILDRLKKEIHLQAEEKYPSLEVSSIKTVLDDSQETDSLTLIKSYMESSLSTEIFNARLAGSDRKLLKNVIEYVHANLENTELSVEGMSKKLGLSRNHLHRKLKALTGKSPVEFIKIIRMCYAAHFLGTGQWSVSEVGYKVGYNTPSYFSSSFSAYFGMTPTAYMEKIHINTP